MRKVGADTPPIPLGAGPWSFREAIVRISFVERLFCLALCYVSDACVMHLMLVLWSHACLMVSCLSYGLMLVLWSHACLMVSCLSYGLMLVLWSHACLMVSCLSYGLMHV